MRVRSIYAIATALILAATIGVQTSSAQSEALKSRIPFEFYAGGKLLPAGSYIVSRVNPSTLRLQAAEGGKSVYMLVDLESGSTNDGHWLLFNQYGKRSFLAKVSWSGAANSLRVPMSREEREVARIAGHLTPVRIAAR